MCIYVSSQECRQKHSLMTATKLYENIEYLGTTVRNQNCIREEIKSRMDT